MTGRRGALVAPMTARWAFFVLVTMTALGCSEDDEQAAAPLSSLAGATTFYVAPARGPVAGGTEVSIHGKGFIPNAEVRFGATRALGVRRVHDGLLIATAPSHAHGRVAVTVLHGGAVYVALSDAYEFTGAPALGVAGVRPSFGSTRGGTSVLLSGVGFGPGTGVTFGGASAVDLEILGEGLLRAVTPAGRVGTVDIEVIGATSRAVLENGFDYEPDGLSISSALPARGDAAGGTEIAVEGFGLRPETSATLGGEQVGLVWASRRSARFIAPALPPGLHDLLLTNPGGDEAMLEGAWQAVPGDLRVTGLSRRTGRGGALVSVTGSGLTEDTAVLFGDLEAGDGIDAEQTAWLSDARTLTVVVPLSDTRRTVDVTILRPDGQSAVLTDAFELFPGLDGGGLCAEGEQSTVDRPCDERPYVVGAASTSAYEVRVRFSEPMLDTSFVASNFQIGSPSTGPAAHLVVVGVEIGHAGDDGWVQDDSVATLYTLAQAPVEWELRVSDVRDYGGNAVAPGLPGRPRNHAVFQGTPERADAVARRLRDGILGRWLPSWTAPDCPGTDPGADALPTDSDCDGVTDADEQIGRTLTIRRGGRELPRGVSSDPLRADTDNDGANDREEYAFGADPRAPDTDFDTIGDALEIQVWHSNPANDDTDGDGLTETVEAQPGVGTSFLLADTDGDQISDYDELVGGVLHPRVADIPSFDIRASDVRLSLDIRTTSTNIHGNQATSDRTIESTLTGGSEFGTTRSTRLGYEASFQLGGTVGFTYTPRVVLGTGGAVPTCFFTCPSASINVGTSASGTFAFDSSQSSRTQMSNAYMTSQVSETEDSTTVDTVRSVEGASIVASVQIETRSTTAFTVTNLEVSVMVREPGGPTAPLTPVATLVPTRDPLLRNIQEPLSLTLGPLTPRQGPIVFVSTHAIPSLVEELMRRPEAVVVTVANYDVLTEDGRNFAFVSEDINNRTATLQIDFGPGRPAQTHRIAAVGRFDPRTGRPVGITMLEALQAIGYAPWSLHDPARLDVPIFDQTGAAVPLPSPARELCDGYSTLDCPEIQGTYGLGFYHMQTEHHVVDLDNDDVPDDPHDMDGDGIPNHVAADGVAWPDPASQFGPANPGGYDNCPTTCQIPASPVRRCSEQRTRACTADVDCAGAGTCDGSIRSTLPPGCVGDCAEAHRQLATQRCVQGTGDADGDGVGDACDPDAPDNAYRRRVRLTRLGDRAGFVNLQDGATDVRADPVTTGRWWHFLHDDVDVGEAYDLACFGEGQPAPFHSRALAALDARAAFDLDACQRAAAQNPGAPLPDICRGCRVLTLAPGQTYLAAFTQDRDRDSVLEIVEEAHGSRDDNTCKRGTSWAATTPPSPDDGAGDEGRCERTPTSVCVSNADCGASGPCVFQWPCDDTDGDGVPDRVEIYGYDRNVPITDTPVANRVRDWTVTTWHSDGAPVPLADRWSAGWPWRWTPTFPSRVYAGYTEAERTWDASFTASKLQYRDEPQPPRPTTSDPGRADSDGDGLNDGRERLLGTDPREPDTDSDGISDWDEHYGYLADVFYDLDEYGGDCSRFGRPQADQDSGPSNQPAWFPGWDSYTGDAPWWPSCRLTMTDPLVADTDGDSLLDGVELRAGLDPLDPTDAGYLRDTDADGLTDRQECPDQPCLDWRNPVRPAMRTFLCVGPGGAECPGCTAGRCPLYSNPADADSDSDGLTDFVEYDIGTSPMTADTDGDGVDDFIEWDFLTSPAGTTGMNRLPTLQALCDAIPACDLDPGDPEDHLGTHPAHADTDRDGVDDGAEIDGWRSVRVDPGNNYAVTSIDVTSDPTMADTDGDGLSDATERRYQSNPRSFDTDNDGIDDCDEGDTAAPLGCRTQAGPTPGHTIPEVRVEFDLNEIQVWGNNECLRSAERYTVLELLTVNNYISPSLFSCRPATFPPFINDACRSCSGSTYFPIADGSLPSRRLGPENTQTYASSDGISNSRDPRVVRLSQTCAELQALIVGDLPIPGLHPDDRGYLGTHMGRTRSCREVVASPSGCAGSTAWNHALRLEARAGSGSPVEILGWGGLSGTGPVRATPRCDLLALREDIHHNYSSIRSNRCIADYAGFTENASRLCLDRGLEVDSTVCDTVAGVSCGRSVAPEFARSLDGQYTCVAPYMGLSVDAGGYRGLEIPMNLNPGSVTRREFRVPVHGTAELALEWRTAGGCDGLATPARHVRASSTQSPRQDGDRREPVSGAEYSISGAELLRERVLRRELFFNSPHGLFARPQADPWGVVITARVAQ